MRTVKRGSYEPQSKPSEQARRAGILGAALSGEVEAQLRALRFVRNLTPASIDQVIADVRSGKVKL